MAKVKKTSVLKRKSIIVALLVLAFLLISLAVTTAIATNKELSLDVSESYACDIKANGVCTQFTTQDSQGNKTVWTTNSDGSSTATKKTNGVPTSTWKVDSNGKYVKNSLRNTNEGLSSKVVKDRKSSRFSEKIKGWWRGSR